MPLYYLLELPRRCCRRHRHDYQVDYAVTPLARYAAADIISPAAIRLAIGHWHRILPLRQPLLIFSLLLLNAAFSHATSCWYRVIYYALLLPLLLVIIDWYCRHLLLTDDIELHYFGLFCLHYIYYWPHWHTDICIWCLLTYDIRHCRYAITDIAAILHAFADIFGWYIIYWHIDLPLRLIRQADVSWRGWWRLTLSVGSHERTPPMADIDNRILPRTLAVIIQYLQPLSLAAATLKPLLSRHAE